MTTTLHNNKIQEVFASKKNILNIFFTAGYPRLEDTTKILKLLQDQGVDLVEIGMPYSDPLADGPVIQGSSQVALNNGMNLKTLFNQLSQTKETIDIPIILMGYYNQLLQYGVREFCESCQKIGVSGLIIPDLPMEEYESEYKEMFKSYGLSFTFLITPQTSDERILKMDELSEGFLYVVSDSSITGGKREFNNRIQSYYERIGKMGLNNPILIGFGISDKKSYQQACQYSDGAIIGSAFIKALKNGKDLDSSVRQFISSIR
ncbi:tryptophan synthase subunit alpha [Xanthovirga aplysinae]|uniref:tryptophan synthase subunit alpha n=1 Tax=Xanthovirga aplysinae TaxID=2529853 RepID=UPI0012BBBF26|nr:tryptophan synthase subunit alpha [Xanthovirga aplysinae]MTI33331.1 tryptophan synthase subunit alpha [Xanthovirga aplysinae]